MFRLDRTTHRYLIEPVSKTPHIKISLLTCFMNFTNKLMCSRKTAAKSKKNYALLQKDQNIRNNIQRDIGKELPSHSGSRDGDWILSRSCWKFVTMQS